MHTQEVAAEHGDRSDWISLLIAFLVLVYMWALMTGIGPAATRGLTQRLITVPMFAWFGYASLGVLWGVLQARNSSVSGDHLQR